MSEQPLSRADEIRHIHAQYRNFYRLLGGGALVLIGVVIGAILFTGNAPAIADITGYFTNLYTEAVSVILTIAVLNFLQERREERRRERDLQEQLVREAGSRVNATAVTAIDMIRKRGWLFGKGVKRHTNGILECMDLTYANLSEADLRNANLYGVQLYFANLSRANLYQADLRKSHLGYADLRFTNLGSSRLNGAGMRGVDLRSAFLGDIDLRGAFLGEADLSNSDLRMADLQDVNLLDANLYDSFISEDTKFNLETTLPDGSKWSPERNLSEFGAETRLAKNYGNDSTYQVITFADGVTRRYQYLKGWLDDKNGNPIDGAES